ncbi:MAG: RHS repeat protein, partial [Pleurocapsa sp. SU_196_0]|nr:RHS repeat protein [Pleurocapsa sp. SU_196_0]
MKGFSPSWDAVTAPPLLYLSHGGTDGAFYERLLEPNFDTAPLASAPAWIKRYRVLGDRALVYREQLNARAAPSGGWVVAILRGKDRAIAHHYDRHGRRTTFSSAGEFAAFVQNPYQQVRSAQAGTPDGDAAGSPRTEYGYAAPGLIDRFADEWGRVNTYTWDVASARLEAANLLLRDPQDAGSWTRRLEFGYERIGDGWYLNALTVRSLNGADGITVRRWQFGYATVNGAVVLARVSQERLPNRFVSRLYTYANDLRLKSVRAVAGLTAQDPQTEPEIQYLFERGSDFQGVKLTVRQGDGDARRERVLHLDGLGLVRRELVWDANPYVAQSGSLNTAKSIPAVRWLKTDYAYLPNGLLASVTYPAGRKLAYQYDAHANLIREETWAGGALQRWRTWHYDADNRMTLEVTPALEGAGYSSLEVRRTAEISDVYRASAASVAREEVSLGFEVPRAVRYDLLVDGKRVRGNVEQFDDRGRLMSRTESGAGLTRTQSFTYADGLGVALPRPDEQGDATTGPVQPQYGDLVTSSALEGARTDFLYDAQGRVVRERRVSGLVVGFSEGARPRRADRVLMRSFDGDGQLVWEHAASDTGAQTAVEARQRLYYGETGLLERAWSGAPTNLVVYTRETTGADLGRVRQVERGLGDRNGATLVQSRERRRFQYDAFGRVVVEAFGDVSRRLAYDTLDRVVFEVNALGLTRGYAYGVEGQRVATEERADADTTERLETSGFDALGRLVQHELTTGGSSVSMLTTYDPWDQPIRTVDNRLTMNRAGEDRTTFRVFDSLGRLVKELGPTKASAASVPDARRSYREFAYDAFDRNIESRQLLEGTIGPDALSFEAATNLPSGSIVATTASTYDAQDRAVSETDPEGFRRVYEYDDLGNRTLIVRQLCPGDRASAGCSSAIEGLATLDGVQNAVAERFAFDALGREREHIDATGAKERVEYATVGEVSQRADRRGVATELREYTGDGLLERILVPDNASGSPADGTRSGYVATTVHEYGASLYPVRTCVAVNERPAETGACREYALDAVGNVLRERSGTTDLVTRRFDARGFLLETRDAEGF